jgi:hypothetical protein
MSPSLARECLAVGATRKTATDFFFEEIHHYLIAGDTPLHAAAAGYRKDIAHALIKNGADVTSENRRGACPLHYAADGGPAFRNWNPLAQAGMITFLIKNGANPNSLDKSGVAPLHRAVRQRRGFTVVQRRWRSAQKQKRIDSSAPRRAKHRQGRPIRSLSSQNPGDAS